jgi:DMSO/TMAO reductase YedYZ molybdopterin-dependent catalytic subunit
MYHPEYGRRRILKGAVGALGTLALGDALATVKGGSTAALGLAELPDGTLAEQILYRLPGKVPLIKKTFRPPNFETPLQYLRTPITRNDAFFVRWHLSAIPEVSLKLTMSDLRKFKPAQVTAVCQCSGNRRGLSEPHVAGVEWGVGAMGNAVWRGVRLKDVLEKAGVKSGAVEVWLNGADRGPLEKTPDFKKSLPVDVAMRDDVIIAYEMNGRALPHWNGFPARLIVPGWTGTYWVKMLTDVQVMSEPDKNFWMSAAYRIPRGKFPTPTFKSQLYAANEPITTMVVNSLITSLHVAQQFPRGKPIPVHGLAWDGGSGIAKVEISTDGASWKPAKLGRDLGRYAFREFSLEIPTREPGSLVVMARATAKSGETQVDKLIFNPAGYHNNVIQRVYVEVV